LKQKKPVANVKKIAPEVKDLKIELFTRESDEFAQAEAQKRKQRQKRKIEFISGKEFDLNDFINDVMVGHHTKFVKDWFYRLADLYKVDRKLMDTFVKPDFVRLFIIQFVYGRFPYLLLRTLRSQNRKLHGKGGRLFQHLKDDKSKELDEVIDQVYKAMDGCDTPLQFKEKYSALYKIYFQTELF
jgi:hypothetical protein